MFFYQIKRHQLLLLFLSSFFYSNSYSTDPLTDPESAKKLLPLIFCDAQGKTTSIFVARESYQEVLRMMITTAIQKGQAPAIHVNVNNNNHLEAHTTVTTLVTVTLPERARSWFSWLLGNLTLKNNIILGALTATSVYSYSWYTIYKTIELIENSDALCNWLEVHGSKESDAERFDTLITYIQEHFANKNNYTDYITPLNTFLELLRQEELLLTATYTKGKLARRLFLRRIFPLSNEQMMSICKKVENLKKLKKLFLQQIVHMKARHCART